MIRVICNKDLKHSDGSISFSKGTLYVSNYSNTLSENTLLVNNQNQPHKIGFQWLKNFRQV